MTSDPETLAVYDTQAHAYEARVAEKTTPGLQDFIASLPAGAHILDLGCGPGLSSLVMLDYGLTVDATDGSAVMVARAKELGVEARQALFHEVTGDAIYDGIFANFSLLHLPKSEMPAMLDRLHIMLKPAGRLHIGLKLGEGEARDRLGRFYSYYHPEELEQLLTSAGFTPITRILGTGTGLDGWSSEWIVVHAKI